MITYEFLSDKTWLSVYSHLEDCRCRFTSYAYKCITVFDKTSKDTLEKFCDSRRLCVRNVYYE